MRQPCSPAAAEIETLRNTIRQHEYEYYVLSQPTVSDAEFDALMAQLKQLEADNPDCASASSPTKRVGGEPLAGFQSVVHVTPMLSIANCFSAEALDHFNDSVAAAVAQPTYCAEYKIDGIAVNLHYENGVLTQAASRGDGDVGDDITENVRTICNVPYVLRARDADAPVPTSLDVRGEIYVRNSDFMAYREREVAAGKPAPANPRNTAGGALRLLDPRECAARPLRFVAHGIGRTSAETPSTHSAWMHYLRALGLPIIPEMRGSMAWSELRAYVQTLCDALPTLDMPVDGIVVKVDALASQREIGTNSKEPLWAVAYKWERYEAETTVTGIELSVTRTGVLAPVALLEPVEIAGTTVSRVSLSNCSMIRRLDLTVGDTVVVEKAGKIIPHVVRVLHDRRPADAVTFQFPTTCPSCNAAVVRDDNDVNLLCSNPPGCPAQLKALLCSFASRRCMDIAGLADEMANKLVDNGLVRGIADLYTLKHCRDVLLRIRGIGKGKADKLLAGIEASKTRPLTNLLAGLNIRHLGVTISERLVARFGTMLNIAAASADELRQVEGVGDSILAGLAAFFDSPGNRELIVALSEAGVNMGQEPTAQVVTGPLSGQVICITGELSRYSRDAAHAAVAAAGGRASGSVTRKTTLLVVGSAPGQTKRTKAAELGIPIVDEAEFLRRLEA
jgi:DNA ligase (NAD+)